MLPYLFQIISVNTAPKKKNEIKQNKSRTELSWQDQRPSVWNKWNEGLFGDNISYPIDTNLAPVRVNSQGERNLKLLFLVKEH